MAREHTKERQILAVIEILRKHTDEEKGLSLTEIVGKLSEGYGMELTPKLVRSILRNLRNLNGEFLTVGCDEHERKNKYYDPENEMSEEKSPIQTNWYLRHEFSDAELLLMIDSLFLSKDIPPRLRLEMIKKLKGLTNNDFNKKMSFNYGRYKESVVKDGRYLFKSLKRFSGRGKLVQRLITYRNIVKEENHAEISF